MPVTGLLLRNASKQQITLFRLAYVHKLACEAHSAGSMQRMSTGNPAPQVAVIGAGISGAMCSHLLARRGAKVDVFDMGRQLPGGRASSRVPGSNGGASGGGGGTSSHASATDFQFDYGCQFFTATSPHMKKLVDEWLEAGVVAEWRPRMGVYDVAHGVLRPGKELSAAEMRELGSRLPPLTSPGEPLYVGVPFMGALVDHLLGARGGGERKGTVTAGIGDSSAAEAAVEGGGGGGGSITLRLNTGVQRARWSGSSWLLGGQRSRSRDTDGGGGGGSDTQTSASHGSQRNAGTVHTSSSSPAGGGGGGCWDLGGPYDALVFTDSQVARPGAPGYVELQGAPSSLQDLTVRLREQVRVPQFTLVVGWSPEEQQQPEAAAAATVGQAAPQLPADALYLIGGSAVQWVAIDTSKPGRHRSDGGECWVAITRPDFAAKMLHLPGTQVTMGDGNSLPPPRSSPQQQQPQQEPALPPASAEYRAARAAEIWTALQRDLQGMLGSTPLPPPSFITSHRWGSCYTTTPLGPAAVWDTGSRWAACGDFCQGPGLEPAAASGAAAAEAVAKMLGLPSAA